MARRHRDRDRPRRHQPLLPSKPRILILCEGQKTEHVYFSALKVEMRLSSVRVWRPPKVRGLRGLTKAADEARRDDPGLDEIWCVFDHDGREEEVRKFLAWHEHARKRRTGPTIRTALSDPCFEYWLLLHFEYTTRPFTGPGGCLQVVNRLRRYDDDYRKGTRRFFDGLANLRDGAIRNAARAAKAGSSPGTGVGRLIRRLRELDAVEHVKSRNRGQIS